MAPTLAELLAAPSSAEVLATQTALAAAAGFPLTSSQSGSVGTTFFTVESLAYADLAAVIGQLAAGGFLDFAEDGWLDLCAQQVYNLQRTPSVFTRGSLRLTDVGGVGPLTLTARLLEVRSGEQRFNNLAAVTLPANGSVVFGAEALFPGLDGNVLDGSDFELVTSLPGVTVEQVTPLGGTWITQQGADAESDASLRARCRGRWGELGHGAVDLAYLFWVRTAAPEISRAVVQEATGDGTVRVVVAGPSGPIGTAGLVAANLYLLDPGRRVQCVRPAVVNATVASVALDGSIKIKAAQVASAKAAALAAISKHFALLPLGATIYRAPLEAAILASHPAIVNAALAWPAEQTIATTAVPVANASPLAWVGV